MFNTSNNDKKIFIIQVPPTRNNEHHYHFNDELHSCRAQCLFTPHTQHTPASRGFSLAWFLSIAKSFASPNNPTTGQTSHAKTSQMLKAICRKEKCAHRVHTLMYPSTGTMSLQMENKVTKRDHHSSVSKFTLMSSVCIFKIE